MPIRKKKKGKKRAVVGSRSAAKTRVSNGRAEVVGEHTSNFIALLTQESDDAPSYTHHCSLGFTINLGDYESVKLNVSPGGKFPVECAVAHATKEIVDELRAQVDVMSEQIGLRRTLRDLLKVRR